MVEHGFLAKLKKLQLQLSLVAVFLIFPLTAYASFIEATIGTAVINDATAGYFNPAALTLVNNPQFVMLGSVANLQSQFSGEATQKITGYAQSGTSNTHSTFYLPSVYLATPVTPKLTWGLAVVANDFNRDLDGNSILRYVQPSNQVADIDLVPSVGLKINEYFSVGAGLNFSKASFITEPVTGLPSLNIPDSTSHNDSDGKSWGGDVGILLKPAKSTLIGLNYRSAMTYQFIGTSSVDSHPGLTVYNYHFKYWIPARSVFTISRFVTRDLGLLATVQYIQWGIFKDVNMYNLATQVGTQPVILPHATVHYNFHNTWNVTLGGQYYITHDWVFRVASSYVPSPSSGNYQIDNGDSIIAGASTGYNITKKIIIDGSYAHSFVFNKNINILGPRNLVEGVNKASGDSVSLKLTLNI
jgi:long-chain fatty acid transport protein